MGDTVRPSGLFEDRDMYREALLKLNQGMVILDSRQRIRFWNGYMESITGLAAEDVAGRVIYEVLPRMDTLYLRQAVGYVLDSGFKYFFSAAIHGSVLDSEEKLNLNISLLREKEERFLLFEFVNVTDEFVRVHELKRNIRDLHRLNAELKKKEDIIKKLAYYDVLTGVGNRTLFYKLAEKFLNKAEKKQEILAFLFIDVDRFKSINDTYGHVAGDKVITRVAEMLKEATGRRDIVTRYGGDEFVILMPHIRNIGELKQAIHRIKQFPDRTIRLGSDTVEISLSIGAGLFPFDGDNLDQLISKADAAMYLDKKKTMTGLGIALDGRLKSLPFDIRE